MDNVVEEIVINVEFDRQQHIDTLASEVQVVPSDIKWEDLELMLKVYADSEHITVLYWDEDNDQVQIDSQAELLEAFKVAKRFQNTLRIHVMCSSVSQPSHTAQAACKAASSGFSGESKSNGQGAAAGDESVKYFYLKNASDDQLVLDVQGHGCQPGTPVILWGRKSFDPLCPSSANNQLWYEHGLTRTIRTAMNDFCLDLNGDKLAIYNYIGEKPSQRFAIVGNHIQWLGHADYNELYIVGVKLSDIFQSSCALTVGPQHSLINSHWIKEYVDYTLPVFPLNIQLPIWIPAYMDSFRKDIVNDIGGLFSSMISFDGTQNKPETTENKIFHCGVYCDNCDSGIVGVRYKCGYCNNYDLCSSCERKTPAVHDPSHVLLKMPVLIDDVKLNRSVIDHIMSRSASQTGTLGARFVRDETIPDGSNVAPGEQLRKMWTLRNTGSSTWTPSNTVLRLVTGTVFVNTESRLNCEVAPGQEGSVSAELVAPLLSGCYTSHWRLVDTETQTAFGPIIWCQINVDPALATVQSCDQAIEIDVAPPMSANRVDVALSTEDLFAFVKTLEKTANTGNNSRPGPLAVPTNTPIAATPPLYTPVAGLSRVSSSDSISSLANEAIPSRCVRDLNMAVMADLVHEKMNELSLPGGRTSDAVTSETESSDGSFYVVPIPDCFITDLPPSKMTSTSLIVKKETSICSLNRDSIRMQSTVASECDQLPDHLIINCPPVVDAMVRSIDSNDSALYCQTDDCAAVEYFDNETETVLVGENDVDVDRMQMMLHNKVLARPFEVDSIEPRDKQFSSAAVLDDAMPGHASNRAVLDATLAETELEDRHERTTDVAVPRTNDDSDTDDENNVDEEDSDEDGDEEDGDVVEQEIVAARKPPSREPSLEGMAVGLLTSTIEGASKLAAAAYHTAKDVYHTLQARNAYVPVQSEWIPRESTWTPRPDSFVPPSDDADWSPPSWTPTLMENDTPAALASDDPMHALIEMGFGNRALNAEFLRLYGNNVDRVVQELIVASEAEWHAMRH